VERADVATHAPDDSRPGEIDDIAVDLSDRASIDTGSTAFWRLSDDERDEAFALLRRDAPIAPMPPVEDDLVGLLQENPTTSRAGFRRRAVRLKRTAATKGGASGSWVRLLPTG
jgi:hypothetical protein